MDFTKLEKGLDEKLAKANGKEETAPEWTDYKKAIASLRLLGIDCNVEDGKHTVMPRRAKPNTEPVQPTQDNAKNFFAHFQKKL